MFLVGLDVADPEELIHALLILVQNGLEPFRVSSAIKMHVRFAVSFPILMNFF